MKKREKSRIEKISEQCIFFVILSTGVFTFTPLFNGDDNPFEVYDVVIPKYDHRIIDSIVVVDPTLNARVAQKDNTLEIKNEKITPPETISIPLPKGLEVTIQQ